MWIGFETPRLPPCEDISCCKSMFMPLSEAMYKAIYVMIAIFTMVVMTTISVTEAVKEKLLKVASELQLKLGRRVDLNEALKFLVEQKEKHPQLLEEACKPISGAKEAVEELQEERKLDEARLERKISHRHQRTD